MDRIPIGKGERAVLAEGFSRLGVPVFMADVKGDVSGLARPGEAGDRIRQRAEQTGVEGWAPEASPVVFWDVYGKDGHPVRTTISEVGPGLLSRILGLSEVQAGTLFDEAHLLFDDAPAALRERVEQVVRLIRSKGVGRRDLPAESLPRRGRGHLAARRGRSAGLDAAGERRTDAGRAHAHRATALPDGGHLQRGARGRPRPQPDRTEVRHAAEPGLGLRDAEPQGGTDRDGGAAGPTPPQTGQGGYLGDLLWGSGRRQGMVETMAKQAARTVGSQISRSIMRGVLGGMLGGSRRR